MKNKFITVAFPFADNEDEAIIFGRKTPIEQQMAELKKLKVKHGNNHPDFEEVVILSRFGSRVKSVKFQRAQEKPAPPKPAPPAPPKPTTAKIEPKKG